MRALTLELLGDLHVAAATGAHRGDIRNKRWDLTWRLGVRRVEHVAREDVFTIHNISLAGRSRGRGHFTELMRHLVEVPDLAGRRIRWIYIEQAHYRLANHLQRECGFKADFGMVIDCWRQVTGQLEMGL